MSPLESVQAAMAKIYHEYNEGVDPPIIPKLQEALKVAILNLDEDAETAVLVAIADIPGVP